MVHRGMDTDMDGQLVLRFLLTWVQFKNSIWNYIHRNLFIIFGEFIDNYFYKMQTIFFIKAMILN
jgi:hypothetical protein